MLDLERRVKQLEQLRRQFERPQTIRILYAGAYEHVGHFIVSAGKRDHIMEREQNEAFAAFAARVDKLATGTLKLLIFTPITPEGKTILSDNSETL